MLLRTVCLRAWWLGWAAIGCGDQAPAPQCAGLTTATEFSTSILCASDFNALASEPLDASIPGARSAKLIVDRVNENSLTIQNSVLFPTHFQFASTHLSGNSLPIVPSLAEFNTTEYYSPSRRFLLGALTYYEQPQKWVYEIAPYDTADAAMIETAYQLLQDNFFGELYFHPTSEQVTAAATTLPGTVKVISTDELFADITYQPLNPATSFGQLRFFRAADLSAGAAYLSFRDIAVLDNVPNDISVAMGIITDAFQTPLSHVNVLSKNRGTPNMALRGAWDDPQLRALEGKWVKLTVGLLEYEVAEVTQAEADAWWEANKPSAVQVPGADLTSTDLRDDVDLIQYDGSVLIGDLVKVTTRAYGGKAAHFGALTEVGDVPMPKGFAVPIYYYRQFMATNGFDTRVMSMLADPAFQNDPATRDAMLAALRADMQAAPLDATFLATLTAKLMAEYPSTRMRFRSSTNAEDLDGFTGAGLYTSASGDLNDPTAPIEDAIRKVWASVWFFKAFEERSYRSIDHLAVGMALLVHRSYPDEEATGVAVTNNPFDQSGLSPAFYINAQVGDNSVVLPPVGVTTDQVLLYWDQPGQPTSYLAHSNLITPGTNVLTRSQLLELGTALSRIHEFFRSSYGDGVTWYAMDIEWKLDGADGEEPRISIKQARPYSN